MRGELDIKLWDLDGDMNCNCSNINFFHSYDWKKGQTYWPKLDEHTIHIVLVNYRTTYKRYKQFDIVLGWWNYCKHPLNNSFKLMLFESNGGELDEFCFTKVHRFSSRAPPILWN